MSISRVSLTYKAEKLNAQGQHVAVPFQTTAGGSSLTQLVGQGATGAAARQQIQDQINAAKTVLNTASQDVQDADTAFNS